MPFEIDFGKTPMGHVLQAARGGDSAVVQYSEFTSTEDGQHFIQRLEGYPDEILKLLAPQQQFVPSQVDTLLAIIRRDGAATVHVNDVGQIARVRPSRPVAKGALVSKNDIADIEGLELSVQVPPDAGVLFLFSVGWRKGLFYDFGPIGGPNPQPRAYDLTAVFGQAYCHVLFQERFSITDDNWTKLLNSKWFPFVAFGEAMIQSLIGHISAGWDPDELVDRIASEVNERLPTMQDAWRNHSSFAPHIQLLERAVEHFQKGDYLSSTGLLFPRIEGILRTHHTSKNTSTKPSPSNLTASAVADRIANENCLLLPHKFAKYLTDVYFANFNPVAHDIDVSRHSVAHGVANISKFDKKSALIGILVVHQLFYCLDLKQEKPRD